MSDHSALASRIGDFFGIQDPPTLTTQTLVRGDLAVSQIGCDTNLGVTRLVPPQDALIVGLAIHECAAFEYAVDGRPAVRTSVVVGDTMLHDLNRDPIGNMLSPFRSLMFYLPRKALDEIAYNADASRIGGFSLQPGTAVFDPIVNQLGTSLLPALERPNEASCLFVDYVLMAVSTHVAHTYGGMRRLSKPIIGGLAPWQERRAKEILNANLDGDVSLVALATECGLSVGHFARAFRQSTGTAPHRWLLEQRINKAQGLLCNSSLSLADIALACGFADQSHFTRAFTHAVTISPGTWRRMRMR